MRQFLGSSSTSESESAPSSGLEGAQAESPVSPVRSNYEASERDEDENIALESEHRENEAHSDSKLRWWNLDLVKKLTMLVKIQKCSVMLEFGKFHCPPRSC